MKVHKVKSWPKLFAAAKNGEKQHELRKNDRDYKVGDLLVLQEFDPETQSYSGCEICVEITYITSAEAPCAISTEAMGNEFCILSIRAVGQSIELAPKLAKHTQA
jgi:hypothetical protein